MRTKEEEEVIEKVSFIFFKILLTRILAEFDSRRKEGLELTGTVDAVRASLLRVAGVVKRVAERAAIECWDENTWSYDGDEGIFRLCIRQYDGEWGIYIENECGDETCGTQSLVDAGNSDMISTSEHIFSLLEKYCAILHKERVDLRNVLLAGEILAASSMQGSLLGSLLESEMLKELGIKQV